MDKNKYEDVLLSKRFSIQEKQLFLIGSIAELILSREHFKNNSTIRDYAEFFFDSVGEELKNYLLDSRTVLVGRITRIILSSNDFQLVTNYINYHTSYLDKNLSSQKKKKNDKNSESILDVLLKSKETDK